jgi:hypothetical protein
MLEDNIFNGKLFSCSFKNCTKELYYLFIISSNSGLRAVLLFVNDINSGSYFLVGVIRLNQGTTLMPNRFIISFAI